MPNAVNILENINISNNITAIEPSSTTIRLNSTNTSRSTVFSFQFNTNSNQFKTT